MEKTLRVNGRTLGHEISVSGSVCRARRRSEPWVGFEWLREPDRRTISVQSGCPVGCLFCDAGLIPYGGNLTLAELRLQAGEAPKELRLTRMGEPTFNPAVLELIAETRARRVLLSTVVPDCPAAERFLDRLRDKNDRRVTLQISFPSTEREGRRALVPIKTWPASKIAVFGRDWSRAGGRKIVLSVALTRSFPFDPDEAAAVFDPDFFTWAFTPVNDSRRALRNKIDRSWRVPPVSVSRRMRRLAEFGFRSVARLEDDCGRLSLR